MLEKYSFKTEDAVGIADTIREVGKIEGKLIWPEGWKTAIRQLNGVTPQLIVTAPEGSTITALNGDNTVTGVVGAEGTLTLDLPAFGTWEVTATLNEKKASTSIRIEQEYLIKLNYTILTTIHGAPNEVVTVKVGAEDVVQVVLDDDGDWVGDIAGIENKTVTFTGSISNHTETVDVGNVEELSVNVYPDGALYWYGRQVVAITTSSSVVGTSEWTYVSPTFNSDHILLKTTNANKYQCPIITGAPIDISGYSTLKVLINFTYTDYGSFNFGISPQNTTGYSDASPAKVDSYRTAGNQQTLPVALGSVDKTNKYYVFSHVGRIAEAKIYKMWLE